ncbi:unnamed protein product [Amoebophrya sp. A120]|nr:unnamed protein product [Amoebophrya sp. A120]|eukprot:GSA120T00006705001.1
MSWLGGGPRNGSFAVPQNQAPFTSSSNLQRGGSSASSSMSNTGINGGAATSTPSRPQFAFGGTTTGGHASTGPSAALSLPVPQDNVVDDVASSSTAFNVGDPVYVSAPEHGYLAGTVVETLPTLVVECEPDPERGIERARLQVGAGADHFGRPGTPTRLGTPTGQRPGTPTRPGTPGTNAFGTGTTAAARQVFPRPKPEEAVNNRQGSKNWRTSLLGGGSSTSAVGSNKTGTSGGLRLSNSGSFRNRVGTAVAVGKPDCTSLTHLDEANILENLRVRYCEDQIYTFTGAVLFAVNPYKPVYLDTDQKRLEYKNLTNIHQRPPHPYALADLAYRQLLCDKESQAMVISGESGAGKTETAKMVMKFLGERSRTEQSQAASLQEKILSAANPLLESFGNATTIRNGNSSRFGKYNNLCFNAVGSLVGAEVRTYLLEASRVLNSAEAERTYHVFYEFFAGAENLEDYFLLPDGEYNLLRTRAKARDDADNYKVLIQSLDFVNVKDQEQGDLLSVLAALIHLGEVRFKDREHGIEGELEMANKEHFDYACAQAGFDDVTLYDHLTTTKNTIARHMKDSICLKHNTKDQANGMLQSLMKILYSRLFDWMVEKVNRAVKDTSKGEAHRNYIGILDIYGFEQLQSNSLEQLCINLANERLQQFFVEKVLVAEQTMYEREGLTWKPIPLPDAQPVLDDVRFVLAELNDFNKQANKGLQTATDEKFCEKIHKERRKNVQFPFIGKKAVQRAGREQALAQNAGFVIRHYAGEVEYETRSWIEKNNTRMKTGPEQVIRDSVNPLVQQLQDEEACNLADNPTAKTIGKSYVTNLEKLMETLDKCSLHYIRCFKPNNEQRPNYWQGQTILEQMVQSGTIELVRVMRDGYPNRCPFEDLYHRFTPLLPPEFSENTDPRMFVESLMLAFDVPLREWTLGTTRLFLKAGRMAVLEALKASGAEASGPVLKKLRKLVWKKKLRRCLNVIRFSIHLKNIMKNVRKNAIRMGLVRVTRTYLRLMRWAGRARIFLRNKRLATLACRVHKAVRVAIGLDAWLCRTRVRLAAQRLLRHLWRMLLLTVYGRRYITKNLRPRLYTAARHRARVQTFVHEIFRISLLKMYMRNVRLEKKEKIEERKRQEEARRREEEERQRAEEERKRCAQEEQERLKREEEARLAREEAKRLAREEEERRAKEEAERLAVAAEQKRQYEERKKRELEEHLQAALKEQDGTLQARAEYSSELQKIAEERRRREREEEQLWEEQLDEAKKLEQEAIHQRKRQSSAAFLHQRQQAKRSVQLFLTVAWLKVFLVRRRKQRTENKQVAIQTPNLSMIEGFSPLQGAANATVDACSPLALDSANDNDILPPPAASKGTTGAGEAGASMRRASGSTAHIKLRSSGVHDIKNELLGSSEIPFPRRTNELEVEPGGRDEHQPAFVGTGGATSSTARPKTGAAVSSKAKGKRSAAEQRARMEELAVPKNYQVSTLKKFNDFSHPVPQAPASSSTMNRGGAVVRGRSRSFDTYQPPQRITYSRGATPTARGAAGVAFGRGRSGSNDLLNPAENIPNNHRAASRPRTRSHSGERARSASAPRSISAGARAGSGPLRQESKPPFRNAVSPARVPLGRSSFRQPSPLAASSSAQQIGFGANTLAPAESSNARHEPELDQQEGRASGRDASPKAAAATLFPPTASAGEPEVQAVHCDLMTRGVSPNARSGASSRKMSSVSPSNTRDQRLQDQAAPRHSGSGRAEGVPAVAELPVASGGAGLVDLIGFGTAPLSAEGRRSSQNEPIPNSARSRLSSSPRPSSDKVSSQPFAAATAFKAAASTVPAGAPSRPQSTERGKKRSATANRSNINLTQQNFAFGSRVNSAPKGGPPANASSTPSRSNNFAPAARRGTAGSSSAQQKNTAQQSSQLNASFQRPNSPRNGNRGPNSTARFVRQVSPRIDTGLRGPRPQALSKNPSAAALQPAGFSARTRPAIEPIANSRSGGGGVNHSSAASTSNLRHNTPHGAPPVVLKPNGRNVNSGAGAATSSSGRHFEQASAGTGPASGGGYSSQGTSYFPGHNRNPLASTSRTGLNNNFNLETSFARSRSGSRDRDFRSHSRDRGGQAAARGAQAPKSSSRQGSNNSRDRDYRSNSAGPRSRGNTDENVDPMANIQPPMQHASSSSSSQQHNLNFLSQSLNNAAQIGQHQSKALSTTAAKNTKPDQPRKLSAASGTGGTSKNALMRASPPKGAFGRPPRVTGGSTIMQHSSAGPARSVRGRHGSGEGSSDYPPVTSKLRQPSLRSMSRSKASQDPHQL